VAFELRFYCRGLHDLAQGSDFADEMSLVGAEWHSN
jgi:hypothetical protein